MSSLPTVASLARELAAGKTSSRELVERALARIADPAGEGARTFIRVHAERARADADACDRKRKDGVVPSPLAGIPVSVKDLFDVAGDVTTAGSKVLRDAPAASADAVAVARLRVAGAVVIGRTNMTEFAYSGIGINPHYGTPANPWDRATRRVPGGSSSGAAVSVADGMAVIGLGTDTGGSVRNPAALCGVAGFKPTQRRVPLAGCFPLSGSLDSIGPLAPSIACCASAFQVLAAEPVRALEPAALAGLRLGVPKNVVLDDLDPEVARAFDAALAQVSSRGARLVDMRLPELDEIAVANRRGGILAPEAYALHRKRLAERGADYDPRVRRRLEAAKDVPAADYVELLQLRSRLVSGFRRERLGVDALLVPTVPKIAPAIEPLEGDMERFFAVNPLMLRNTSPFNFLDTCAASLPIQRRGEAPVGLTVAGFPGEDERVLAIALAVEAALGTPA
ncbi:MAG TPA: amidase [Burkholderiales bacterium]|nr:amidase [Burkholderiales bacterium]